jgi:hypothetical protein
MMVLDPEQIVAVSGPAFTTGSGFKAFAKTVSA